MNKEKQMIPKDYLNNFYTVQGWMLSYGLSLKEVSVYAIIYGFSQDRKTLFYGSLQYLAFWTCSSKRQIENILKSLIEKGLIKKTFKIENNVKQCFYRALRPDANQYGNDCHSIEIVATGYGNDCHGYGNDCHGGMEMVATNNIDIRNLKDSDKKENHSSLHLNQTQKEILKNHARMSQPLSCWICGCDTTGLFFTQKGKLYCCCKHNTQNNSDDSKKCPGYFVYDKIKDTWEKRK